MAGPRKVGDLVLLHTSRTKRVACLLIRVGSVVFAGNGRSTIASSLLQHLASQARLVVHFEHIDAEVWCARCDRLLHRVLPALRGLMRKPGDQIDVDFIDASRSDARKLRHALLLGM